MEKSSVPWLMGAHNFLLWTLWRCEGQVVRFDHWTSIHHGSKWPEGETERHQ